MYQQVFNESQINGSDPLSYTINVTGCNLKIDNQSPYALDVFQSTEQIHRINPYGFYILDNAEYTVKVNRTIKSENVQPYAFVSFETLTDTQKTTGSTAFTGTLNTNITNSTINAEITNSTLNTTIVNSQIPVTVENSQLDVNITNASIPVTGNVQATITNASIPVTGTVNATITNASMPVTGNVNATITNASMPVSGSVNIGNTPNVTITGTPNVNATIQNASIPVTGSVSANITNASIPVSGNVGITGTANVNVTGTPNVAITGTPSVNIANASVPITGNVGITSGTINANIQNASLTTNSTILNEMLSSNVLVKIYDGTASPWQIINLAPNGTQGRNCFLDNPGFFDTVIVSVKANGTGAKYGLTSNSITYYSFVPTEGGGAMAITSLTQPGTQPQYFNFICRMNTPSLIDNVNIEVQNITGSLIPSDSLIVKVYGVHSSSGSNTVPNYNAKLTYKPNATELNTTPNDGVFEKELSNNFYQVFPSGAQTGTKSWTALTNPGWKGCMLTLSVTAMGTGTIQVLIYAITKSGLTPFIFTSPAVSSTGLYTYLIYPGATGGSTTTTNCTGIVLPRQFNVRVTKSDASSWTYSLDIDLLK
jgi:hypothetical protein